MRATHEGVTDGGENQPKSLIRTVNDGAGGSNFNDSKRRKRSFCGQLKTKMGNRNERKEIVTHSGG